MSAIYIQRLIAKDIDIKDSADAWKYLSFILKIVQSWQSNCLPPAHSQKAYVSTKELVLKIYILRISHPTVTLII